MNNVILSTKKTNSIEVKLFLILDLVPILVGFWLIWFYFDLVDSLSSYEDATFIAFCWVVGIIFVGWGVFDLYKSLMSADSYLEIYDDGIKGQAIQSFRLMKFNIKLTDINNITISGVSIYLHTTSGKYQIVSNLKTAQKVMQYYESIK